MEVRELEEAEAVEEGREVWEFPFALHDAHIEEGGAPFFAEAEEAEEGGEEGVERENFFEFENAFALVDEACEFVGLALEAFRVEAGAEALAEGGDFLRQRGGDGGMAAAQGVFFGDSCGTS
jgi:hypothetical protein